MKKPLQATAFENKCGRFILFSVCIIIIVMFLGLHFFSPAPSASFQTGEIKDYNTGWYILSDYDQDAITLPNRVSVGNHTPVMLSRTLTDEFNEPTALRIHCSHQNLEVILNGKTIYSFTHSEKSNFHSLGSLWHLVQLPADSAGKALTLRFTAVHAPRSSRLYPISIGSRDALLMDLMQKNFPCLIYSLLIMVLGVFLVLFFLLFKHIFALKSSALLHLGTFAILVSLWLLGESNMLQFFFASPHIISCFTYLGISTFTIPLNLYFHEICSKKIGTVFFWLSAISFGSFLLAVILQITGLYDFYQYLPIQQACLSLNFLISDALLFYDALANKNKHVINVLPAFTTLFICGVLELVFFYFFPDFSTTSLFRVGILLFLILLTVRSMRSAYQLISRGQEATHYEELANTDVLTKGFNRTAYEEELKKYETGKKSLSGLCYILFDLNDLKYINDRFGHAAGDDALKKAFSCISRAFSDLGHCYRIGGDEFATLLPDVPTATLAMRLDDFQRYIVETRKDCSYYFDIACGMAVYGPEDGSLSAFLNRADQKMFLDKKQRKEQAPQSLRRPSR